jgi:hypothetical protein
MDSAADQDADGEGLHRNVDEVFDPASNRMFYHNTLTGKTGWTLAEVLDENEMNEVRERLNTIERHQQFVDSLAETRVEQETAKLESMHMLSDEEKIQLKLKEKHEKSKRSTLLASSGTYNKSKRSTLLGRKTKLMKKKKNFSTLDSTLEVDVTEGEFRNGRNSSSSSGSSGSLSSYGSSRSFMSSGSVEGTTDDFSLQIILSHVFTFSGPQKSCLWNQNTNFLLTRLLHYTHAPVQTNQQIHKQTHSPFNQPAIDSDRRGATIYYHMLRWLPSLLIVQSINSIDSHDTSLLIFQSINISVY